MLNQSLKPKIGWVCGIYAIFSPERMVYVGQAFDINQRWLEHRTTLNAGKLKEHSDTFIEDWHKFGEQAFDFIVLEECEYSLLAEREQWHMDQFERRHLYNRTWAGNSRLGVTNRKPRRDKGNRKCSSRLGLQIELPDGNIFLSIREFARICGYNSCSGVRRLLKSGYTYADIARHCKVLNDFEFKIPRGYGKTTYNLKYFR